MASPSAETLRPQRGRNTIHVDTTGKTASTTMNSGPFTAKSTKYTTNEITNDSGTVDSMCSSSQQLKRDPHKMPSRESPAPQHRPPTTVSAAYHEISRWLTQIRTDPMHAQPAPSTPIMRCAASPRPFSRNSAYTMMTTIAATASPIPEYTHERSMLHS